MRVKKKAPVRVKKPMRVKKLQGRPPQVKGTALSVVVPPPPLPPGRLAVGDPTLEPDRNPVIRYLLSLDSAVSRKTMGSALDRALPVPSILRRPGLAAARIAWHELGTTRLGAMRLRIIGQYAPATANRMLWAIKGVLKAAVMVTPRLISRDALADAIDILRPAKGKRVAAGREITIEEFRKLFASCGEGPLGARNAALLAIAMMGLRRSEIASLQWESYDQVGESLKVLGKGNKERSVPLAAGAQRALVRWLEARGEEPGPLLTRFTQHGALTSKSITEQTIYNVIRHVAKAAGIVKLTPHDFRRTMVSRILDQGDIAAAQAMAGHADVATTLRYDRRGERIKQAAADKLNVPFEEEPV